MDKSKPTPYAYAPTKSGTKLPLELGKPEERLHVHTATEDSDEEQPRFRVPDFSDDENDTNLQVQPDDMFARRDHYRRRAPTPPPQPPRRRPGQCTCNRCPDVMPTRREKKCCGEEELLNTHLDGYEPAPGHCVLESPDIQHCLHKITIRHKWIDQQRYFGHNGAALNPINMTDKKLQVSRL